MCSQLVATVASSQLVERAGRKLLLYIGIVMMLCALVPLALAYGTVGNDPEPSSGAAAVEATVGMLEQRTRDAATRGGSWLGRGLSDGGGLTGAWSTITVVALILYVCGYQVGFGPITWLLVSEGFPLEVRSLAIAFANTSNFLLNLITTITNAPLVDAIGQSALFWFFGVMCVVSLTFVYVVVPETKGLTLEQIDAVMREGGGECCGGGRGKSAA